MVYGQSRFSEKHDTDVIQIHMAGGAVKLIRDGITIIIYTKRDRHRRVSGGNNSLCDTRKYDLARRRVWGTKLVSNSRSQTLLNVTSHAITVSQAEPALLRKLWKIRFTRKWQTISNDIDKNHPVRERLCQPSKKIIKIEKKIQFLRLCAAITKYYDGTVHSVCKCIYKTA